MKKQMDKLKKKTSSNKRIIIFLFGLFMIGLIAGSLFVTIISKTDQALVKEYVKEFIARIDKGKLNYIDAFKNTSISNITFLIIAWLLGLSFILGFSLSSFILQYKAKGILVAIFYFFPHHIINMLSYTLMMIYSLKISYVLINSIIKKKSINFKPIMNRYLMILGICISMIIVAALYECFIVPFIIQKFIGVLS